jgi:hypothetical protein
MGQKWYQSTAYDLPISPLVFLFYFKEPWPFILKELFFSSLKNFKSGVFGKCGIHCKLCCSGELHALHITVIHSAAFRNHWYRGKLQGGVKFAAERYIPGTLFCG